VKDTIFFVVPGSLDMRTGGYGYDRRIIEGLTSLGWALKTIELGGSYPFPNPADRAQAAAHLAAVPTGAVVVVDGLAYGVLPDIAEAERERLHLVALVHHPLADETGLSEVKKEFLSQSERAALQFARHVIVTSAYTARRIEDLGISSAFISVVEPGNDPAPVAAGTYGRVKGEFRLLCPASFIPRKGHSDLLSALSELASYPWTLTCVGNTQIDPVCFADVTARRDEMRLGARVALQGEVGDEELCRLYADADLVALASLYEGFGMVVTEAIARGIPVVTTTGGALIDTLPRGAGLASRPGEVSAFRENLRRVFSDAHIYTELRTNALAARERLPTWPQASEKFATALSRACP
jgi:glycosyltransferase involved in cell wall biosynthesis